jgi:hypothetical protein
MDYRQWQDLTPIFMSEHILLFCGGESSETIEKVPRAF